MLVEDIEEERDKAGIARWDPTFGPAIALVPDPGAKVTDENLPISSTSPRIQDPHAFGSYFIFRKLEQNVRGFKRRELDIAINILILPPEKRELAGAMIVGRFEDGTPVTMSGVATGREPSNDFDYDGDAGVRCPFHSHIRKANPRGRGGFEHESDEKMHLMPRRGIPYEDVKRVVLPPAVPEADDLADFDANVADLLMEKDIGLLFMAYNNNIAEQFQFTQQSWANAGKFPRKPMPPAAAIPIGIDPVIGQGAGVGPQNLPPDWDDAGAQIPAPFQGFVTTKGGEYFFSPSVAFLKSL